ncbi:MAG: (d)CMP kinase [Bacteroidetes bacterium]|nr:MAG: (d)CMP kinase [Bacteroidota bacterium]
MNKKLIIAVDGHSSCGKSTLAKDIAKHLNYKYIDTGAMYRAVTYYVIENKLYEGKIINEEALKKDLDAGKINIDFRYNPELKQSETYLNGKHIEREIRGIEVSNLVSPVAVIPFVRKKLVDLQRAMGKEGGIVMDGRDIGTNVFPNADLKIFLTADAEIRAQRRYDELKAKGEDVSLEAIVKNIKERDYIDSHRETNPLRQAKDAVLLDNSHLTMQEQAQKAIELAENILTRNMH